MTLGVDLLTVLAISAGCFFFVAGTAGILRFPDTLTRLHALTKADNLGLGLVMLGLVPQTGDLVVALKLVCIWLVALVSSALVSQLIAGAERHTGPAPWP
jgi:multicomponent Na+:H+ antiporter subunit G